MHLQLVSEKFGKVVTVDTKKHPARKVGTRPPGSVDPSFAAGLPFPAPKILEFISFFGLGKRGSFEKGHFLEILENLEILEFLENHQNVENKGSSDHFLEILDLVDVSDIFYFSSRVREGEGGVRGAGGGQVGFLLKIPRGGVSQDGAGPRGREGVCGELANLGGGGGGG